MAKTISSSGANYYHIATEGPLGLSARAYLTSRGIKYNTSYHTRFPEGLRTILGIPESLTWRYIRWFHKHSGRCLATTQSVAQELEQQGITGVVTWTRGVDQTLFNPQPRTTKPYKTLLCVSRVSKEKSLERFCELQIPGTRKVLVGSGPHLNYLQNQYGDVDFVGMKHGQELANYYQQADVFVFPSRWDTFGIVMLEAIACGTPIAAYPCNGPLDVVEPGTNGYLAEDLSRAVEQCFSLNKARVYMTSTKWTWQRCWEIFRDNLVEPT
jgi:glycosyltransferase involved in cell wall biosynthesis